MVELVGTSVEMEIVVIIWVTSIVETWLMIMRVPYPSLACCTRALFLFEHQKLTPPSVVVRLMVLVNVCTIGIVVTAQLSSTFVQSCPPSPAALQIFAVT